MITSESKGIYLSKFVIIGGLAGGLGIILLVGLLCGLVARPNNCIEPEITQLPSTTSTSTVRPTTLSSTSTAAPTSPTSSSTSTLRPTSTSTRTTTTTTTTTTTSTTKTSTQSKLKSI